MRHGSYETSSVVRLALGGLMEKTPSWAQVGAKSRFWEAAQTGAPIDPLTRRNEWQKGDQAPETEDPTD
jgi:hypothetical protein